MQPWLAPPDLGPLPRVGTAAQWGARPRDLARRPGLQRLTTGLWVEQAAPLRPLQRAVLLQRALNRPEGSLIRLTGLSALALLGLPLGDDVPVQDRFLRHSPPPLRAQAEQRAREVHLCWSGQRRQVRYPRVRLEKSFDLPGVPGPWGSSLVHPVEALVTASPLMQRWRITACLDALLSHRLVDPSGVARPPYTREDLEHALGLLPPCSRAVLRCRSAYRDTAARTWSPMETLTRLHVVSAGLPAPRMNLPVTIDGRQRYLDLGWEGPRVALEYNGAVHMDRARYGDDVYRAHRMQDAGWAVRHLVWEDLCRPGRLAQWLDWLRAMLLSD